MRAIQINEAGGQPVLTDIPAPATVDADQVLINVKAVALSNLAKRVAQGQHYSSDAHYPKTVGLDGVGELADGTPVYFDQPMDGGTLAEQVVVPLERVLELPNGLDLNQAAALANPGMSSVAALVYRAHVKPGETVLINGATGVAGTLAVKIARLLGAEKVIVTGRRAAALAQTGADVMIASEGLDLEQTEDRAAYAQSIGAVASSVDVVLDYLYGASAEILLDVLAKKTAGSHTVRFVQIGSMAGTTIQLPASVLRASKIELMGSGLQSVDADDLQDAIEHVYQLAQRYDLTVPVQTFDVAQINQAWDAGNNPRTVITF